MFDRPPGSMRRLSLASRVAIVIVTVCAASCSAISDPDAPTRATLDALVARHASRDEIAKELTGSYTWYAPETDAWAGLLQSLRGGGTDYLAPVQTAVRQNRKIMFHTTMWQQTWIFLDDEERAESYWLNSQ
jgi:hypothetical protein